MVPFLLAASDSEFGVRLFIIALLVAVVVGLIAYVICLLLNHLGVPVPAGPVAALVALLAFALYLLDGID